jgi:drug/metabolite transporter (DMT)-like permease
MPPGIHAPMHSGALLALFVTAVIWGIGPVFIRTLSVDLGPADHLAIRYAIVAVAYLAGLALLGGWRIARADWPRLLVISFAGMLGYNLGSAFGFAHVTAGIGSLIIGTQPLLIALLGSAVAKEKLTPAGLIGLMIGFSGTVLLVWHDVGIGGNSASFLEGCALVFGAGAAWAVYVIGSKPLVNRYGSFAITAWSISIAAACLLALFGRPSAMATALAMPAHSWLEMAYMAGFSTFLATILWNYGAGRVPSAAAGAFIYLVPIIGVAASALILHEPITAGMLAGGGMILLGVAIAQFAPAWTR